MPSIQIISPTVARIHGLSDQDIQHLKSNLTYTDQKVSFEARKFKHATWYANQHGYDAWREKYEGLKAREKQCLLLQDYDGYWVYSGLAGKVSRLLGGCPVERAYEYPEYGVLGWHSRPPFEPYGYQTAAWEALLAANHAGVEIGTGLGKSFIIALLVKEIGLKTVVMAPSKDIAKRLYSDFVELFGPKKVGFYGDGKKKPKFITVAIGASLTRVEEGSADWKALAEARLFIADESHQCPAATLSKVCFGLLKNAEYRFFMSATQMRNDGLDMLLEAITGPIVYTKTVREGIDEGYLARLDSVMVMADSGSDWISKDPNEDTREHLYYNEKVIRQAADIANKFAQFQGKRILILVEELEQFTKLYPHLQHSVKFAHGGVSKENRDKLPEMFHDSDPSAFVKEFNDEQFTILVGTSCITTGTDIKANEVTINLQGGKSEIQVMQGACGRSTRLFQFKDGRKKTSCTIIDFDVQNNETTHRHARARKAIYDATYGPTKEISYGN